MHNVRHTFLKYLSILPLSEGGGGGGGGEEGIYC